MVKIFYTIGSTDRARSLTGQEKKDWLVYSRSLQLNSANSTTPFHADAEVNVLAHIKGEKHFHIFDNADRSLLSEEEMELSPSNYRNKSYDSAYESKGRVFKLNPGYGLHVPYMSPH